MSIPISRYYDLLKAFEEYEKRNPPTKIEREDNKMLYNVTIKKSENKVIEEYFEMQAVKSGSKSDLMISNPELCIGKGNLIIKRKEVKNKPTIEEIAQFLSDTGADFVSVEHNYRFEPDLPFC